tara:strand:+ start:252 stop:374 length:123 start_codon:yes stop_codon:yes gene_type:complete
LNTTFVDVIKKINFGGDKKLTPPNSSLKDYKYNMNMIKRF